MPGSIMKKSSFMTRRKIIIYIIATILILGIVSGFSDPFLPDNTVYKATVGETIVAEKAPPASGTPADYDLMSNLQFAAYKLHHSSYFRGETDGTVVADIGFTTYTQKLTNTRVVLDENTVFAETVSSSSLKSLAEQKYADNGIIIYRPSTKISGGKATYSDTAYRMTYENYANNYGTVPNQLSKYIIDPKTIIAVRDDNAEAALSYAARRGGVAYADEADDSDAVGYYVPENLVADADGNYCFTLTLDPETSTRYYRNEVRTLGGADQNPKFHSAQVTVKIAPDWTPIWVTTVENYDIAIPVLGAMNCTGTNVETFYDIDAQGELPERDFFQPYIDSAKNDPDYVPPAPPAPTVTSPADYLAAAFADYLSGAKPLELTADIAVGDISAYDLTISADLQTLDIQAMLGDLYVKYSGDKVYINLNELNGYMSTSDFAELMTYPQISELFGALGDLSDFDITALFGGDMLGTVFADCEMTTTDGVTRIRLPFALDATALGGGEITVDASLYIDDQTKALKSIDGTIAAFGKTITVSAKPLKRSPRFPSTDGAADISGILDFIPDALETLSKPTLGINGRISAMGYDIDITAYVDRTDGLKADATLTALGLDIDIKYVDETVYVSLGNINARGTTDELPALIDAVLGSTGNDLGKYADMIKPLLPTSVNDLIGMVRSLEVTDGTLDIGLRALTVPVSISLERADGMISALGFGINVDMFGIEFDATADLGLTSPEPRDITLPDGDFVTFAELAAFVDDIKQYAQSGACYDINVDGSVTVNGTSYPVAARIALDSSENGFTASGVSNVLGQTATFTYVDDTAYVALGNIKLRLASSDISELGLPIARMISMFANGATDTSDMLGKLLGAIGSVKFDDNGALVATVDIDGNTLLITLDASAGKLAIAGNALGAALALDIDMTPSETSHGITAPADAGSYANVAELGATLDKLADVLETRALTATANVYLGDTTVTLGLELDFGETFKARITENTYGLCATVIGKTAYIELGDVRVAGSLDDVPALLDALGGLIPAELRATIDEILGGKLDIDIPAALATALDCIKSVSADNGRLRIGLSYNDINIDIDAAADITDAVVSISGASLSARVTLADVSLGAPDIAVSGQYVPARTLLDAVRPVLPLARANGFDIAVRVKLGNIDVVGSVYVCLGDGTVTIDAALTVGDLPVRIAMTDGTLYLSVGSTINVSQRLAEQAIMSLLDELDRALPGIKAKAIAIIEQIRSMTLEKMLGCISLVPTDSGFTATLDMSKDGTDITVALTAKTENGELGALALDCELFGTAFSVELDATVTDGVLTALVMPETQADDAIVNGINIGIAAADKHAINIDASKYVDARKIAELIAPILDLVKSANGARSITLDVNAFLLTKNNAQTAIKGSIAVSLDPLAVDASLRLFAGTSAETELDIVFVNGTLYVKTGNIMLSFDTAHNLQRLYDVLSDYLPEYINDEIAKLFGLESGASAFSDIAQLIDRLKELSAAQGVMNKLELLFAPLKTVAGNSTVKTAIDMVSIFDRDGAISVGLNVMGVTLNATPALNADKTAVVGFSVDTSIVGHTFKFGVDGFALSDSPIRIAAPQNAADYVSIVEFIETIDNAVKTFTTRDADGNITFETRTFDFDYQTFEIETTTDENGNTVNVKDEAGRDKPRVDENGNKIVASTVKVYNKPDHSALKGKFIRDEQTDADGNVISVSYKFNLEAHIVLDIDTLKNSTPITLDLYVINNSDTSGIAFIDYTEGNGHGERISIDYNSIMQIAAAAFDIIGVDDDIVDMLLGEYRLDIDTSIFDSMDIAGLDTIKDTLTKSVGAVQYVKDGIAAAKDGWNSIATAGSIEELRKRLNDVKAKFGNAVELIKTAVSLFTAESAAIDGSPVETTDEPTALNGELFKQIVNGITLEKTDAHIRATVDNSITTGADGDAAVTVTQSNKRIDGINVNGLDVNTAKLQNFDVKFTAGGNVDIALPDGYNTTVGNSTYSDFADIKHLLFDVMNTANMFEFEIGDATAATDSNKIELGIKLLGVESIKINFRYNVKVRIIDQGEGAEPRYKTAATVELIFQNCKAAGALLVPNCTTKLYFYDNVIYVKGLEWYEEAYKNWLGQTKYEWKQRDIAVAYTVEQLGNMLSSDIGMEKLMYELLFYMLPLSRDFTFVGIDLQGKIAESVSAPSTGADPAPTVATVFKGYAYDGGTHSVKIGLSELAEAPDSNMLGDLTVTLTGKNDGDDNILDNYISAASITTSLVNNSACTINVRLFAELRNPETYTDPADGIQKLRSKGLTDTTDGHIFDGIINNVIPSTDWQYIWA